MILYASFLFSWFFSLNKIEEHFTKCNFAALFLFPFFSPLCFVGLTLKKYTFLM